MSEYKRLTWINEEGVALPINGTKYPLDDDTEKCLERLAELEDKIESGELSFNYNLYKTAFELILQDVYETRLQADTMSCSSCPFMEEIFDECQNQGLYEDCKRQWQKYYLEQAEARLKELKGEKV